MSCNAINDFKNCFESKGFTQTQGKNVLLITEQVNITVVSLGEVDTLPDVTFGDIL